MISFNEALKLIFEHPLSLGQQELSLEHALGGVLADELKSLSDNPPFDNSAVDGFAVRVSDIVLSRPLEIKKEILAQKQEPWTLPPQSCARIMTGAPVPDGADAVIMKEMSEIIGDKAQFSINPNLKDHIRFRGEDLTRGEVIAKRGTIITPQIIGLALGLGIHKASVIKKPRIRIIATGDELILAPKPLSFGEAYYFVGPMIKAQCMAMGFNDVLISHVGDDENDIEYAIKEALEGDLVLITGGMSKGSRDFVRPSLKKVGVKEIFFEGYWRPGKPLYFGRLGETRIFGLPGNPVAAFMCFRIFVQHLLSISTDTKKWRQYQWATITHDTKKKAEFDMFCRAVVNERNELTLLDNQGSHQMGALRTANALCHLESPHAIVKAFEPVKYYAI